LTFQQLEGLCCAQQGGEGMALTIGQVAKSTGVAARTIRFYEDAGVLAAPRRSGAGYRQYSENGVQQLLFIRRARALGLSLRDLKTLMAALDGPVSGPVRPRVRQLVRAHLAAVQSQIRDLTQLERQLAHVLRRIRTRSGRRSGGRCRCLDLEDPQALAGRRDVGPR
jgi:DNA-binding transcriptional MerR regulator